MTRPAYLVQLAEFAAQWPGDEIPAEVRARAALVLADTLACMLAGMGARPVRRLLSLLGATDVPVTADAEVAGREGLVRVPGTRLWLPPADAAYVGGTAGTWHDLDEGNLHTRAHAAIQILPAALAQAQCGGQAGREFMDAFVLAYEVAGRLWRATSARLAVHPHGTYGPLAAAVALCRLRRLDAAATAEVMCLAMTMGTAASRQALNDGATVRNTYSGHSGRAAFDALRLFEAGFSGEHDAPGSILGHIYGDAFDAELAAEALGSTWWLKQCYFKRFASGRYVHAALDALEDLLSRHGGEFAADTIRRVDVRTFFMAATMSQPHAHSAFGLRFSLPMLMAERIVRGRPALLDDGEATFADGRVHALATRIQVVEDPAATARYPNFQPASVVVELTDGRTLEAHVERMLGESDCPLPEGVLEAKFMGLTAASLSPVQAQPAYAAALDIDADHDVAELLARFVPSSDTDPP